jgi:hypothetical protein
MRKYTLNEKTIKQYCDRYNYKYNFFNNNNKVIIDTHMDMWEVELVEDNMLKNMPPYEIRHINTSGNRTGKIHFHKQYQAWDLHFIFNRLVCHKTNKHIYNETFRIKNILEELKLA